MSGPKIDFAEIRRQELRKLLEARERRKKSIGEVDKLINEINKYIKRLDVAGNESNTEKFIEKCNKNIEILEKNRVIIANGNEKLNVNEIINDCREIVATFKNEYRDIIEYIDNVSKSSQQFEALEKSRKELKQLEKVNIEKIKISSIDNKEDSSESNTNIVSFKDELVDAMNVEGVLSKQKNSILLIQQELIELENSNLDDTKKQKRISRLYSDFKRLLLKINKEVVEVREAYEEYKKECFDIKIAHKNINEFSSIEEINEEIKFVQIIAEKQLAKEYIKRQIDEVMTMHGYNIVESDILEEINDSGQILYGVDDNTAIDVFVSNDNQVTMRVIGIGFDSQISDKEDDALYQKQCAFCSMHPQITAELEMRGVILHTKKHLPPDRKYNKKIKTKNNTNNNSQSKAKKELKRKEKSVMYKNL